MEKEKTSISMNVDLGVDLKEMYEMIRFMHNELRNRQEQYTELEEKLNSYEQQYSELQEQIRILGIENNELQENQETLLEHVWDVDVLWFEDWCLQSSTNIIRLFCNEDVRSNINRLGIVARCGSWNNLMELWELFAHDCEREERSATEDELRGLDIVLRLFNTSQRTKKARLSIPEIGGLCRTSAHTKIGGDGEEITRVILPGLFNVQGELKAKPLVATE